MGQPILEMNGINKAFNGIPVLRDVEFSLEKGEVHALMGGNGAGKSTLMKILTGVYSADQGEIYIDGAEVSINSFEDAQKNKISMIFQEFSLIPTLTVSQNIYLGREAKTAYGFLDDKENERKTEQLLKELGVNIQPTELVQNLGVGYWQMTEIAKALSQDTKILIMDEPTSSLTKSETEILFSFINQLKAKDYSIIYISHRMDEIFQICDRITIMRDGRNVITEACAETDMDSVIQHIVGAEFNKAFEWKERSYRTDVAPVMEIRNLTSGTRVRDISLSVYPGEIVGIAGLMGSGRTELLRAIFGIDPKESGEVLVEGRKQGIKNVQDAIEAGLALIPEDRRMQGLVLQHSVKDNMVLPILSKVKKRILLDNKKANDISKRFVEKLNIKTDNIFKQVNLLSGGNQQKIVLAKWLANEPMVLLLDEPTIGVDIGAKTEIIEIIREMADSGKGIIVVSSELSELLALSDRVIVLHEGCVKKELSRMDIKSEEELQYAIQGF
ncbi:MULTISPECIES: sugar ABC transporter ATP-binding protein [unclassified Paenibacillus]|uniref:sugar ABC transporter ATP-binding protein n=1 Tax=unclassified Paenibacillus TaxID=185978 RepID=UPI002405FA4D|nr:MULTISPECIES: sugar ABC transporter ATP-binding protein [unclassified Paenibacillus]MDF9841733.1 ribose transport system ATP-binding protein [Paenibacillus sp. PastF-2]MDF9848155.1 ribose transport system ATP-binding protein [Paenibacillus sp. PastM-2]MDF9854892.1 ribose transport system ATP-binding protein [Paenibacillus sp. PastF-1]MDH6480162.1 ribose transport system ATP-binding protein [Paenibacillus sp. PastH-2]MDH6507592.1 ribose transport system ATP-binding protein [Paenibacillus sp.